MALPTESSTVNNLHIRPSPYSRYSNSHHLAWSPAHEKRLLHVQAQLAKAQAEWSEDQEIWLDEVHELEERKRKYKKALKKGRRGAKKGTLWRTNSGYSTASAGVTSDEEGDDEVEGEGDDNVQRSRRTSLGFTIRRLSASKRRSTYSEGEVSSIRRSQTTPSTPTFGNILRWWSWKGGKGKSPATTTAVEAAERELTPLRDRRRDSS